MADKMETPTGDKGTRPILPMLTGPKKAEEIYVAESGVSAHEPPIGDPGGITYAANTLVSVYEVDFNNVDPPIIDPEVRQVWTQIKAQQPDGTFMQLPCAITAYIEKIDNDPANKMSHITVQFVRADPDVGASTAPVAGWDFPMMIQFMMVVQHRV
ncbi:MAG: hypothetical protein CL946_06810 [Ectothiorhodospiraceae bacterium]|nr:hypothetical protein [Ectothiorhodospiraceae bacterium]